jgi:hypothetical protein
MVLHFSDPAEIIQTRYGDNEYEYYVHYEGYNRRLDEWVKIITVAVQFVQSFVVGAQSQDNVFQV